MRYLFFLLIIFMASQYTFAYENVFPKTDVGVIEIKKIPAARLLMAQSESNYFKENNDLFRSLFRYIRENDIPMTTPVEAEIDPGAMYFYISSKYSDKKLESTDEVKIVDLPERKVLSVGIRGSYTIENFNEARRALIKHLTEMDNWVQAGPVRAIYWNGPFVPGLLKRSEVHIPIEPDT